MATFHTVLILSLHPFSPEHLNVSADVLVSAGIPLAMGWPWLRADGGPGRDQGVLVLLWKMWPQFQEYTWHVDAFWDSHGAFPIGISCCWPGVLRLCSICKQELFFQKRVFIFVFKNRNVDR